MRLNAHEKLRQIAADEMAEIPALRMDDDSIECVARAADVLLAAEDLLEDIRRRHPGEDFRCPFIVNLSTALDKVSDA